MSMKYYGWILAVTLCASFRAEGQEEARLKNVWLEDSTRSSEAQQGAPALAPAAGRFAILPDNEGRLAFDPALAIALQRALDSMQALNARAGVSAAVLIPGQGLWQGVSGISSKSPAVNVQPEMLFGIGSNTKAFVSTTILSLADSGMLSLDDSLNRYLPAYPNINGTVTIRQLLNMTSGLFDYLNDSGAEGDSVAANPWRLWTPEELIRTFVGPPHRAPGGAYSYCNTDYVLLGMVINKITNQSVSSQIRQRILTPLALDNTFLEVEEYYPDPVAHPWSSGVDFASTPVTAHFSILWTAGGIMSTAGNMARWIEALYEGAVISPSALTQLKTCVPMSSSAAPGFVWNGYGLGVRQGAYCGKPLYGHGGEVNGYVSITGYIPQTGASFAVLFNSSEASTETALTALFDTYLRSIEARMARAGVCYAIGSTADNSRIYLADTSTAMMTAVGAPQYGAIVSGRVDPRTGIFWGLAKGVGWELVQIDGETGEASPRLRIKFPLGAPTDFKGMDFTPDGTLLIGSADGRIYRVSLATGDAVLAATSKIAISGLAIDPLSGALWASIRAHATLRDRIFRINIATGDTTSAGNTGFNQPLVDLAFDAKGNLFGLVGNPTSSALYRLARIDKATGAGTEIGSVGLWGMAGIAFSPATVPTDVEKQSFGGIAAGFKLDQNYPNPFNPTTTISFRLPSRSFASLKIYDLMGRDIATLAAEELPAGIHVRRWNASAQPSGIYFYRLQAGAFMETRRLMLIK
jgi:CubicO group peptidase (beta-lactamase class C family)